jgi:putative ABC transport system permease protein
MIDEIGTFEYQYVLNELIDSNQYGGESIIMSSLENQNGELFNIWGTSNENPFLSLKDMEGNQINLDEGYFVTSVFAMLQNVKAGDDFVLLNPYTLEEFSVKIKGIINNDMQNAIFCNKKNASKILGIDENYSNVIMSDVPLEIPESKIIRTIKKADSKESFENMSSQMDVMIYFLIAIGIIICVASIYIAVNMLISENKSNISMLKVLGYDDKMINSIVLNINHILLPIGYLCSIPFVFLSANWFMAFLAEFIGALPKSYIAPESFLYTAIVVSVSYFGSIFLLRKKVSKINMVESLKGNRE